MNVKTKKLVSGAMLCAIAYVMVVVGRIPVVLFLKYDPKDIIITIGGLIWGPMMSFLVSIVVSLLEMFTISDNGPIGCVMNILSTCSFACTAAFIYKKKHSLNGALVGLILGSIAMTSVMLLWNYLVTPLYTGWPREDVVNLLLPAFLPFNLLKAGLNAGFTFLLYKPLISALRHANLVSATSSNSPRKTPWGVTIVAFIVIVTCVLFILSMRGII